MIETQTEWERKRFERDLMRFTREVKRLEQKLEGAIQDRNLLIRIGIINGYGSYGEIHHLTGIPKSSLWNIVHRRKAD